MKKGVEKEYEHVQTICTTVTLNTHTAVDEIFKQEEESVHRL